MKEKVLKILNEIRSEFDFSSNTDFIKSGMLDSFDVVSLVSALDDEFKISIEGTDILPENFQSIDTIISLLTKYNCK